MAELDSARLLRTLDQLPLHLVLLRGPDLVIEYASAQSRDFFDLAASRGRPAREAQPPPPPEVLALLEQVYRSGQAQRRLAVDVQPLGAGRRPEEEHLIDFSFEPTLDAAGVVDGVLLTGVDVTEGVRSERAAAKSRRQLEAKDQLLGQVLGQAPALMATLTGPDHRYTFTNQDYDEWVGGRARLGRPLAECVPEAAEQGFGAILDQVYRSGEPYVRHEAAVELLDAAGQRRQYYLDLTYQPLRTGQGQTTGILAFMVDATARVQARQRAEAAQAETQALARRLARVTESLPSTTFITDQTGRIEYLSPQWFAYTGQAPDADVAHTWPQLIHPADQPAVAQEFGAALAEGRGWRYEFRLRGADGHYRWFANQGVPEPLAEAQAAGRPQQWFGFTLDIDDLKQAQHQLELKDQQLSNILASAPAAIAVFEGEALRLSYFNDHYQRLAQGRAVLGQTVPELFPEIEAQGYGELLRGVLRAGRPHQVPEAPVWLRDPQSGEEITLYCESSLVPLRQGDAPPHALLSFTIDVTARALARRQAEELQATALRQAEELRALADSVSSFFFSLRPDGEVAYLNAAFFAYTGQPADAPLSAAWDQLHPADLPAVQASFAAAVAQEAPWETQFRLRQAADRAYYWRQCRATPRFDPDTGQLRSYSGVTVEIHALHTAQDELRRSERRYRFLADSVPIFIWTAAPDGAVDYANAPMLRYVGGPAADLADWDGDWLGRVHPDERAAAAAAWQRSVSTGQAYETRHRLRGFDGQFRWLLVRAQPLYDSQQELLKWYGSSIDVHEQQQLQQELQASEEKFRFLTNAVPIYIWTATPEGRIDFVNEPMRRYAGGPAGEAFDGDWLATLHPDDVDTTRARWAAALRTGTDYRVQHRLRGRDGVYRWLLVQAKPLRDAAGDIAKWYGSSVDIQAQRELLDAVRQGQQNFTALADNIAQLAWMAEPDGHIFWYNQRWFDYTGTTLDDMQGWNWEAVHHPDYLPAVRQKWRAQLAAGQPWEDTFPLRNAHGEYRWFLSRARPIRDEATGAIRRWFGTNTDVTELRQLQDELRQSEEELRILAESVPQQVWTARPDGVLDFYNQRTAAYLGEQTGRHDPENWLAQLHPDDQKLARATWEHAVGTGRFYEAEYRLRRHDGQYRWFLAQAQSYRQPGGPVLKWYGTNTDVHEQHELQEALLRREQQFRFLAESVPQIVWTARPDGGTDYLNRRWYDYTGLPETPPGPDESLDFAPLHPDDRAGAVAAWRRSLPGGADYAAEFRLRRRDGEYRWFLAQGRAQRDPATGQVLKWYGTNTDIHDVKEAQALLQAQNARLTRTNQDLDNFVYTASHDLKQPIHNMAGIFEELTRTAYFRDPDAVLLIDYFERSLKQINSTIDELAAIVQVQRQQQQVPTEAVALLPLAQAIVASLHPQITALQAQIELDFAVCPAVDFVRAQLQSVLLNLLGNALKYAAPGRPPRIRLAATRDPRDQHPVLTVQDNGLGIDLARYGDQLFQLFNRFHTHVEGSGMGLYLVNRIVESHGGRIEVSSAVGEGTTFTIHLAGQSIQ